MVNRWNVASITGASSDERTERRVAQKITLKQARLRKLWSANRLAGESGVATTTILDIESGLVATPRLSTIAKLCRALECDPMDIAWPGNPLDDLSEAEE